MSHSTITQKESNNKPHYTMETDNIKYPTFADNFIEEQIKHINHNSIQINLQTLHESLTTFIAKYDNLFKNNFPHSQSLKFSFKKHKMNFLQLRIHFLFLNRQIELFYRIFAIHFSELKDKGLCYDDLAKHRALQLSQRTELGKEFIEVNGYYKCNEEDEVSFKATIAELFNEHCAIEDKMYGMIDSLGKDYLPSTTSFNIAILFVLGILSNLFNNMKMFSSLIDFAAIEDNEVISFYNNLHQLDVCCEVMYNFYRVPSKDIFNLDEDGEEWNRIKEHYTRIVVFSKSVLQKKMDKVIELVNVGYASVSKVNEKYDSAFMKTASAGAYMAYYYFNSKKAKTQSMKFLINPDAKISQMIWNMLDVKGIKTAWKIVLPHIKYSKKWLIKRTEPEITLKALNQLEESVIKADYAINHRRLYKQDNGMELFEGRESKEESQLIIESSGKTHLGKLGEYVRIKIIHSLDFYVKYEERLFDFINSCSVPNRNTTRDALIIHIHGGGFIAMSSSSHENYTRKWANKLQVPVIGIDYSLSPDYPFPKALDDVYQAYMWIIDNAEEMFFMKLKTIILVGDSAGGNIALALANLLITKEKRIPTAVFLAYPALKLCLEELSLSYMNSLSDPVLEFNLLKFCLESYSKNCPDGHNPFMSPLFMTDKIMRYLPAIRIYSGSSDPLRDDSVLLLKRLVDLKKDVQMKELKYFPHGFLSYDNQVMLSEASIANDMIIEDMEMFLL